jgi:hypothetical protein
VFNQPNTGSEHGTTTPEPRGYTHTGALDDVLVVVVGDGVTDDGCPGLVATT